ncbi:BrnT family toxin [Pararhodobacter sp.]|uniref:BrnT family toxin n=1 Tax=Pararhodobacter sp. TaxID=2127056 RepID=UPI003FA7AB5A
MFEWDEAKRLATINKHGLDFLELIAVFEGDYLLVPAKSADETRFGAIAPWEGSLITVFFTYRNENIRLITARRARIHEREQYHAHFSGRRPQAERPH